MRNATRTALIGMLAIATLSPPATATSDDDVPLSRLVFEANNVRHEAPLPRVQIRAATARQRQQVEETLALFDQARLELPPLVIRFSEDPTACEGNLGIYRPRPAGETAIIGICTKMRLTLVHELAHAWDGHSLTDERRQAFMDHWQLDNWNDKGADWHDRGSENAAHTVAYTLLLEEPSDNPDILDYVCGYGVLTGSDLPGLAQASCS
jgi:hypothetical protein